ncbi:hypothetical protein K491DRAFT_223012 [Lophiostoma macrostomum CBS 122681]|uniref:Uncharacterized protein n=1 Tax=Lophiostoma macrostomum CBS 122681 TaxID=1314788 RepID=A0A6A6SPK1_9PLEO|nr:hypothetical protein K491DRAFT_223012 [Lophiostoma macrostomum CBS 122681]
MALTYSTCRLHYMSQATHLLQHHTRRVKNSKTTPWSLRFSECLSRTVFPSPHNHVRKHNYRKHYATRKYLPCTPSGDARHDLRLRIPEYTLQHPYLRPTHTGLLQLAIRPHATITTLAAHVQADILRSDRAVPPSRTLRRRVDHTEFRNSKSTHVSHGVYEPGAFTNKPTTWPIIAPTSPNMQLATPATPRTRSIPTANTDMESAATPASPTHRRQPANRASLRNQPAQAHPPTTTHPHAPSVPAPLGPAEPLELPRVGRAGHATPVLLLLVQLEQPAFRRAPPHALRNRPTLTEPITRDQWSVDMAFLDAFRANPKLREVKLVYHEDKDDLDLGSMFTYTEEDVASGRSDRDGAGLLSTVNEDARDVGRDMWIDEALVVVRNRFVRQAGGLVGRGSRRVRFQCYEQDRDEDGWEFEDGWLGVRIWAEGVERGRGRGGGRR